MQAIPDTIGRYEIRQRLGAGGFATVYRAYDPMLDREVALKVLHPHLVSNGPVRERFLREGRALARVRHPNVVVVHEAGETDGGAYLAMELVEGQTLEEILDAQKQLRLSAVLAFTDQIAAALAAVHAQNLVHRDVKPANIIVERETDRVVLLDLGVVRDLAAQTTGSWIMGTPNFMAPEQVRVGGQVSAQTDVYQLGATVYYLLGGRPPFEGDTLQVLDAIKADPPLDLATLRPDLPPSVVAVIAEAMAKEPERRPPGARPFAGQLRVAMGLDPTVVTPREPAPLPPDAPRPAAGVGSREAVPSAAPTVIQPAAMSAAPVAPAGATTATAPAAEPAANMEYAGFWIRFLALLIDGVVLGIFGNIAGFLSGEGGGNILPIGTVAGVVVGIVYYAVTLSRWGQTFGARVLSIKVVDAEERLLTPGAAALRYLASYLSALILGIGYWMMVRDRRKQTLHDKIAHSYVIKVETPRGF